MQNAADVPNDIGIGILSAKHLNKIRWSKHTK